MQFTEFTISTTSEASELVADILWQYTTYGVAVCDHKDIIELIEKRRETFDYIEEELQKASFLGAMVKAYIELSESDEVAVKINADLASLAKNAQGNIAVGTLETTKRVVEGDDWIEIWKKHFRPIHYGKIVICPKWIEYEAKQNEEVIYIDSNMAFGTGEHETTSMCIDLLEEYVTQGNTVLDIGTGSGILGIAAIKLGAKKSVMTDIDQVAVLSAKHNAQINGCEKACEVWRSDLLNGVTDIGDLAVANITAEILARLTGDIKTQLKQNGILIMSGIINSKLQFVINTFCKCGFAYIKSVNRGEWNAVVMQKVAL